RFVLMTTRYVYFETTIWNVLADQESDSARAFKLLADQGITVALGLNAYYELLRTFFGTKPGAFARGKHLFDYVHNSLMFGARIVKTWEELLIEESEKTLGQGDSVDFLCDNQWHTRLLARARELASGNLPLGAE